MRFAGRIYDRLAERLGRDNVFFDVDAIQPGQDFVNTLSKRVGDCDTLIAIIGKRWTSCVDNESRRRIEDPEDFVRIEVEAALKRDVPVIPVLIDGAPMPLAPELPDGLKELIRKQAVEISHNRFDSDVERLVDAVSEIERAARPPTTALSMRERADGIPAKHVRRRWLLAHELRRINDTQTEPIKGLPYSSRALMTCFDQAADAFGWKEHNPTPGSKRDGEWLVGWGCAASAYPTQMAAATARVRVFSDGRALVETAGHEIGNGLYTVAAQVASEHLGIPVDKVSVSLGDTDLPPAPVAGGSISTASVCTVIAQACDAIRVRLGQEGKPATDVAAAMKDRGMGALEEYAEFIPHGVAKDGVQALYKGAAMPMGGARLKDRIQFAFGAQFVEVRVHARTREIRVPRMVGAFASGRILNPRTAHSQYMGGMIWGIGSAIHEQTEIDPRTSRYVNANLADYMIPVNADIGEVRIIMVPEEDRVINPIGVKGIGEIGIVGTSAALANAIYHATGQRLRDLPLRIDGLITGV